LPVVANTANAYNNSNPSPLDKIIDLLEQRKATTLLKYFAYYKHKTESQYQFWQEGLHPEEMSDETLLMQRLAYIHHTPR
jgi:putative transposase